MQPNNNNSAANGGRPHAHRAMSSSAAFSPYTSSLRRQFFDGQASNPIGQPASIQEGSYLKAIGSARLDGQVVSPPPSGSSYVDPYAQPAQERSRERKERQKLPHTLSGGASFELPPPGEASPAGDRIRSRFDSFNAGNSAGGNSTSPFAAGSGLGFGGSLTQSGARPSFGITSSVSATASTFPHAGHTSLGFGHLASDRDREADRLHDGAPTGFYKGFLNVPMPGTGTRSNSFSGGEWRSPRAMVPVMPSLPSSAALDHYPTSSQPPGGHSQQNLNVDPTQFAETFSDTSSPPSSPRMGSRALQSGEGRGGASRLSARPHSPPRATAFVSRSRSQSFATSGLRPTLGSGLIPMPMLTISANQHAETHSPHITIGSSGNAPTSPWGPSTSPYGRDAFGAANNRVLSDEDITPTNGPDAWQQQRQAERERDKHTHADLANSLQAVLGGLHDQNGGEPQNHDIGNGSSGALDEYTNGSANRNGNENENGNGNGDNASSNGNGVNIRSGASSRRHSVSVVGGPSARTRGFGLPGFGFSDANNTNVVHRHGPVHQAERESIYPQPFGGSNGRFRAGDQPQIATLGSRHLGGYTDDDLLASGFSNQLNLRLEGDQAPSSVAASGAVPIGRRTSTMSSVPGVNVHTSNVNGPGQSHSYGLSPSGLNPSGRDYFGGSPSQSSASPPYSNIETYMHGSAPGPGPMAGANAWPGTADRFRNANNLGSPGSDWSSSTSGLNVMSGNPSTLSSLAPGSAVSDNTGHIGNRGMRAQNGGFVAAPGQPVHMPQGAYANGNSHNAISQAPAVANGPPFVHQRVPGQPMNMIGGFQPVGARGPQGMSAPRPPIPQPYGMAPIPISQNGSRFVPPHTVQPGSAQHRQPSGSNNGHMAGYPPPAVGTSGPSPFTGPNAAGSVLSHNNDEFGRGVSLNNISPHTKLYIVEFKEGRTDLFYPVDPSQRYYEGDLVIVEADRGQDLGRIINDTVSLEDVQDFVAARKQATAQAPSRQLQLGVLQAQLRGVDVGYADPAETAAVQGLNKEILPKRIFRIATRADLQLMQAKRQDEERALALCRSKVLQRGLPMQVHAAEYQWDRRKLTFYFTAAKRIDFRDLVKELFRIHKTRIWMACLGGSYLLTDESDGMYENPDYPTRS